MKRFSRPLLRVEQLEDRCVPAITFFQGNLLLSGPVSGPIQITQNANGTLNVIEGGALQGTFAVTGYLYVNAVNSLNPGGADMVSLTLFPGEGLGGNVFLFTGAGNDAVVVDTAPGGPPALIGGFLDIDTGAGNDVIDLGTGNGLTVGGPTLVNGNLGSDSAVIGGSAAGGGAVSLLGSAIFSGIQNLTVGTGNPVTVGGNFLANSSAENLPTGVLLNLNTQILGSAQILGGNGPDTVTLRGTIDGPATVNLAGGNNTLMVNSGASVAADFVYSGLGSASDNLVFGAAQFNANMTLFLGNGTNSTTFGAAGAPVAVGGNLQVVAGNGVNGLGDFIGTVGGSLLIQVGNGADSFHFDGANGATVGGSVQYFSGAADNAFDISTGGRIVTLNVQFGTGNDVFTIDSAADEANLTGVLNWGDNVFGNDHFNEPAGGAFQLPWTFLGVQ